MSTADREHAEPVIAPAFFPASITPQQLHTFLAVVDAGGRLSAAAGVLGMSQPGVTHQINEIERRLGVRVLDRARGRAAKLTRPGRSLERHARSLIRQYGALHADLESMRTDLGGHLRIGASSGPGEHWLPPLLCEFGAEHEDLTLELHVTDARSIVEMVAASELELGFVGGRWARTGLRFDPVHHDEFVLIVAPGHPLASRRGLTMRDLVGADLVLQEPGTGLRATFENELEERGLSFTDFNVLGEFGTQESAKAAVIGGHGMSCVWRGAVESELELGRLVTLDVDDFTPDNNFYAVRRATRQLTRRSEALLDFLAENL